MPYYKPKPMQAIDLPQQNALGINQSSKEVKHFISFVVQAHD